MEVKDHCQYATQTNGKFASRRWLADIKLRCIVWAAVGDCGLVRVVLYAIAKEYRVCGAVQCGDFVTKLRARAVLFGLCQPQ